MSSELFQCLNCCQSAELTIHGRCSSCGSDAVDPVAREWSHHDIIRAVSDPGYERRICMTRRRLVTASLASLLLSLVLVGCAASGAYQVHPGSGGFTTGTPTAVQLVISHAYDTLLATDGTIQQTRADFLANAFPAAAMPKVKVAFNALVQAYDAAQASWIAFNQAATADPSVPQAALAAALAGVTTAITNLNAAKGGN
jgi:hypothetical protein